VLTGTKIRWWRTAVFEKRLPVTRLGRLVRVDERDLEDFLAANRQPAREGVMPIRTLRRSS